LKNKLAQEVVEMEARGASAKEIDSFVGLGRLRLAAEEGNLDEGSLMCGEIAGMIKEEVSVAEVIRSLVKGYDEVLAHLQ